ncbi:MAG: hypothetical protein WBN37_02695 [Arenicellales bacterium]
MATWGRATTWTRHVISAGVYFGLATNDEKVAGIDHSPGYLRAAARKLAGG